METGPREIGEDEISGGAENVSPEATKSKVEKGKVFLTQQEQGLAAGLENVRPEAVVEARRFFSSL